MSIFDPNSENAEKAKKISDTPIVEYEKILADKNINNIELIFCSLFKKTKILFFLKFMFN